MWMVFIWCMFSFCYGMVDDVTYMNKYYNIDLFDGSTELLYKLLIIVCNKIGLDFAGFRAVEGAILVTFVGMTVWRFAKYPNIVLLLFFLCPFPAYTVQMRSALANSIVIWGTQYLFVEDSNEKTIIGRITISDFKYVICILIATFIHTQSLFWLLFICAKKLTLRTNTVVTILVNIMIYFVFTPSFLVHIFNLFGAGNRINAYLTVAYALSTYRKYGPILYIVFASAISIFACNFIPRKIIEKKEKDNLDILLNLNILMLSIVSIFMRYTPEIYRIQEASLLLNYIYLSNCIKKINTHKMRKVDFVLLALIVLLCVGYLYLSVMHYMYSAIWIPFWHNNSLLGF